MNHVLLLHDDPLFACLIHLLQGGRGELRQARNPLALRTVLRDRNFRPDIALIDMEAPACQQNMELARALVTEIQQLRPDAIIILLVAPHDEETRLLARASGVSILHRPFTARTLLRARRILHGKRDVKQSAAEGHPQAACRSDQHQQLLRTLDNYADMPFPVLITGESGCGKEWAAHTLHELSYRKDRPFLAVNCAAISESLFESIVFGHARGAFTGAVEARAGLFDSVGDGTLFLDEIGELSPAMQAKLLRVLETGEFMRVGEVVSRHCRARIVAATNRDLEACVQNGQFRRDLFYRLSVLALRIAPLRARMEDKLSLWCHFVRQLSRQMGCKPCTLSLQAQSVWVAYPFPGNVRELRNLVIRLLVLYPGREVDGVQMQAALEGVAPDSSPSGDGSAGGAAPAADAWPPVCERWLDRPGFELNQTLRECECALIRAALHKAEGNISAAARLLGLNRTTLYSRMQLSPTRH